MALASRKTVVLILINSFQSLPQPAHEGWPTECLRHGYIFLRRTGWYIKSSPQKTAPLTSSHMAWQIRWGSGCFQGHQVGRELGAGKPWSQRAWSGDGRYNLGKGHKATRISVGPGEGREGQNQHLGRALVMGCVQRAKEKGFRKDSGFASLQTGKRRGPKVRRELFWQVQFVA